MEAASTHRRRLSIPRVFLVVLILSGSMYGATSSFADWREEEMLGEYKPWFAAYIDVTLTPIYAFEKRENVAESDDIILSFIVSSRADPCAPSWGGYYSLDEAAGVLDLDRRIARLQQQDGRVAISFGGARNAELSNACTDREKLKAGYRTVIARYQVNTIDMDLEGEGLRDKDALTRRAEVLAELQKEYRDQGKPLAIWVTLPVTPHGLSQEGTDAVQALLAGKVDLAGVNLMTMDYGEARRSEDSMYEASRKALVESHRQIGILYREAGIPLDRESLWKKIGATPMIGQNDVIGEIFTIDDATKLNLFARDQGIGRMSMWSANRDTTCGENYVDVKVVSNHCTGVKAPVFAFTRALRTGFDGDLVQNAALITVADPASNEHIVDDPVNSPYPVWREGGVYLKGAKVVWHGNVYESKWWNKNDLPDNPVLQSWESPWQLIGPVLPGDKPVKLLTLPAGTYPIWSGGVVYTEGARVMFNEMPYEAKWWNQGESPAASASDPDSSPWLLLTQEQIAAIREVRGW